MIEQRRPEAKSSPDPPGLDVNALFAVVVDELDQDDALRMVQVIGKAQAMLDAVRLRVLGRFSALRGDDPSALKLVACTEKVSTARASRDLALARSVRNRLPRVFAALESGQLGGDRVAQIARATHSLSTSRCREVDQALLPRAREKTPSQLAHLLRVVIAQIDPVGAARRAEKRTAERRVSVGRGSGGMSWLRALLDTDETLAVYKRLDAIAQDVHRGGDRRSLDQLRADTVRDLLLGNMSSRVVTHVYVPSAGHDPSLGPDAGAEPLRTHRGGSHRSGRMSSSGGKTARRGSRKNKVGKRR
ncbi:DUF222 domain-containing protein [Amycolatopsis sp.]|uniref:DUF222 domain-containing protein n=1 Tax=Amycolatopsis sp. TaxID=37632 RepID=UPI00262EE10D|nr:DUF222 domain-containing protein [Amycolatopsis sp.]